MKTREEQQHRHQLASPADTPSESDIDEPQTKRRKAEHTGLQRHLEGSPAHEETIPANLNDKDSNLNMATSYAAARKLDNYPTSTNPVAIALWVVQKLDHAGRAIAETNRPKDSRHSSATSSNGDSPDADYLEDEPKVARGRKAKYAALVNERKRRQRQDNWVKSKLCTMAYGIRY